MSKVEAYKCDVCGTIKEAERMEGVKPVEDMFDRLNSYPCITNPAKADVHFCLDCYRDKVLTPAENRVNRKRDEGAYKTEIDSLAYILRKSAVSAYNLAKKRH